jgi:hypothetical protein
MTNKYDVLEVDSTLVDKIHGNILGYVMRGTPTEAGDIFRASMTLDKIKELNMDLSSYIEFIDAPTQEVIKFKNGYVRMDNVVYREDLKDMPYERINRDTVAVLGYSFLKTDVIEFDVNTCIERAVSGEGYDF